MSSTSSSIFKSLSMADSCLLSLPSISAQKSPSPSISIPSRPTKLHLSYTLSLRKKTQFPSIVVYAVSESEAAVESESAGEGSYAEPSEEAKVFVVNLPYDVDSERLAKLFEEAGVVEIAEVIYDRDTDRSRGFGFVTMSTVEEAAKAVEKFNRYELDGRPLTVTKASPRGESRPRASGFKIYVGNLPWDVDNSALEKIFSEHGKVDDATVVYDRETGRSRGFGFVTMAEESEMNNAIAALNGKSVDGRVLRVNVAEQRPRRF